MTITVYAVFQTMNPPFSGVRERKTMKKSYPKIQLFSKGDGHLRREEPGRTMKKLLTIFKFLSI